jgi:rRNA maturation endonuclease Nob1
MTKVRIAFKSDALSASAWTEAYYASEAFKQGRKGITDTQPHRPVKLSYAHRAAEEVLEEVRDKIAHIREGLLGPEERRGDNEQWIMDLAEVEAVFGEAIKKTALEPMRTVTVELTQADLDAIALGLSLSYEDQASYLQNGDPTMDYAEDLEDTKKFKAKQFRGIAAAAGRLGIYTQQELWESLAEEWESVEIHTDDRERCEVCGAPLEPG